MTKLLLYACDVRTSTHASRRSGRQAVLFEGLLAVKNQRYCVDSHTSEQTVVGGEGKERSNDAV
jgi:hypothetical protein